MAVFTVTRGSAALSTTNDLMTIIAAAGKPLRIMVVELKGMGTASAANSVLVSRSSGGTTGGGTITPRPVDGASSPSFTVNTTWSVQPTLGNEQWRLEPNANGGIDKFVALPGAEILVPAGAQISIRSESGTSNVVANVVVEEIG